MTVTLFAEFTALPGHTETVARLIADFSTAVRSEPGNITFDAHTSQANGDTFFVYEAYANDDSFQQHLASEHGQQFNITLTPLVVGGKSTLTFLTPVPSASAAS